MNIKQQIAKLELEKSKIKTSHILHFLLTIFTGVWVVVWIIAAIRTESKRKAIDTKIADIKFNAIMDME